jgi:hypothetical protein
MADQTEPPARAFTPVVDIADQHGRRLSPATMSHLTVSDVALSFDSGTALFPDQCVVVSIWFPTGGVHCLATVDTVQRTASGRVDALLVFERLAPADRQTIADFVTGVAATSS